MIRHRAGFDAMRARVDSNDREMAQLRVRLEAAGDLAASGALRNSQAQKELEELRFVILRGEIMRLGRSRRL